MLLMMITSFISRSTHVITRIAITIMMMTMMIASARSTISSTSSSRVPTTTRTCTNKFQVTLPTIASSQKMRLSHVQKLVTSISATSSAAFISSLSPSPFSSFLFKRAIVHSSQSSIKSLAHITTTTTTRSTPTSSRYAVEDSFDSITPKQDSSYTSRSRMPFSAPTSAFDDSIPIHKAKSIPQATSSTSSSTSDLAWSRLGLTPDLAKLLTDEMGFHDGPTPIQQMAIPAILSGGTTTSSSSSLNKKQSIAFAAATGSGKTLSYLLPIVQMLKAQEILLTTNTSTNDDDSHNNNHNTSSWKKPKRPRAIILAPTRELTMQIATVLKSLSHTIKLSTTSLIGGEDYTKQKQKLNKHVDIIVSTPGRLVKHWEESNVFLGSVNYVVIDEVDTMLEQGFQSDIGKILHPLLYKHKGSFSVGSGDNNKKKKKNSLEDLDSIELVDSAPQVIMTSATMTNAVRKLLRSSGSSDDFTSSSASSKKQIPSTQEEVKILLPKNMRVLTAPGLHKAVPRLKQVFIDVGNTDKLTLLIDLISNSEKNNLSSSNGGGEGGLTLVFCNTVSSCRAVQHGLTESGIESLSYHGELNSAARAENLNLFRQAGKATLEDHDVDNYNDDVVEEGENKHDSKYDEGDDFNNYDDEDWAAAFEEMDDNEWDESNTITDTDHGRKIDSLSERRKSIPRIMVCTDIAARGLDVPEVDHVVMFDFPLNPIDYLHRAGRTARGVNQQKGISNQNTRAGSGRVSALVAKRDRVLAMAIEGAVQRGEPLDGLSSRKSDYLSGAKLGSRPLGGGIDSRARTVSSGSGRIGRGSGRGGRQGSRSGRGGRGGRGGRR